MKNNPKGFTLVETLIIVAIIGLLAAMIVPLAGIPGGAFQNYANGTRAGVVTKMSNKGLFWKSWEAEMNTGGTVQGENGAVASVFAFNVDPKAVLEIKTALENGKRVQVVYRQWAIKPLSIENSHVVTEVTPAK